MAIDLQALGLAGLSIAEKLELIEKLWDSLPESPTPEQIPAAHLAELATRKAQAEAQPGVGKPWREVVDNLGK